MKAANTPISVCTIKQAWRPLGIVPPKGEIVNAIRNLLARDVITGQDQYLFTVDLLRLWMQKYERLEWVRKEIAPDIAHWIIVPSRISRRTVLVGLAGLVAAMGSLTAYSRWHSDQNDQINKKQAQGVIEQYFNYINSKKYWDAYQLWSEYPDTYENFAKGFAHTLHDDIKISDITPQTDGTVKVYLRLQASEESNSGTTTKIFRGYYIVGPMKVVWKILFEHKGSDPVKRWLSIKRPFVGELWDACRQS